MKNSNELNSAVDKTIGEIRDYIFSTIEFPDSLKDVIVFGKNSSKEDTQSSKKGTAKSKK